LAYEITMIVYVLCVCPKFWIVVSNNMADTQSYEVSCTTNTVMPCSDVWLVDLRQICSCFRVLARHGSCV